MILDGKKISLEIQKEIHQKVATFPGRKPGLAFILVGDNPASESYVKAKNKACASVGIVSKTIELPKTVAEIDLLKQIDHLNLDPSIDGILVQLPLPPHIREKVITEAISPKKDVDGFHPLNMGKLLLGEEGGFLPCTPLGIKVLLERSKIEIEGKHVVILGRSNIVGKPLAALLMQKRAGCNATVTVAHSQSEKLQDLTRSADILIAAIGKPHFVTGDFVKRHAAVVDVGINRLPDGRLVGDVDFKEVEKVAGCITPVPGGIGPMTIAMLLQNTLHSFLKFLVVLFLVTSCQKKEVCTHFEGEVMNLPYQLFIGKSCSQKERKQIQETLEKTFTETYTSFDSEIAKLNEASQNTLLPLSPALQDFLGFCDQMVVLSGKRFDPTVEPLTRLWREKTPPAESIQAVSDAIGWKHISIQNGIFKKDRLDTRLDLGGILTGFCIDTLAKRLQTLGYGDFLIEWAGNFRAMGHHPQKGDWLVQMSPAFTLGKQPIAPLPLRDSALATNVGLNMVDPFTHSPIEKTPFSIAFVSVIAPTSALAEALAASAILFPTRKEAEHWAQEVVEKYPDVRFWILSYQ